MVLEWAAQQNRILLTHDVRTITKFAYDRVRQELKMPGVVEVKRKASIEKIVEDIFILIETGKPEDIENQVIYIPL